MKRMVASGFHDVGERKGERKGGWTKGGTDGGTGGRRKEGVRN